MLALAGHDARRWEPKRLRLRLFSIAARLAEHGRTRQPAPVGARTLGRAARRDDHQTADAASTRLTTHQPAPTTPHARPVEPAPPERPRANRHTPTCTITISDRPPSEPMINERDP